jgi:hypothetical protein
MKNNWLIVLDALAALGRMMLEQNADGATLARQPSAGSENSTTVEARVNSTIEGE